MKCKANMSCNASTMSSKDMDHLRQQCSKANEEHALEGECQACSESNYRLPEMQELEDSLDREREEAKMLRQSNKNLLPNLHCSPIYQCARKEEYFCTCEAKTELFNETYQQCLNAMREWKDRICVIAYCKVKWLQESLELCSKLR